MDRKGFVFTLSILVAIVITPSILFAAQIKLAWDPNSEADLAGYKVYYGTASRVYGTPINVGKVTTYTVTGLTQGQTYYLAVTAFDNATPANVSGYSAEVSGVATDPSQPVSITVSTIPTGLQVVVDSTTYTAPKTFSWTSGSSHTLSLSSPQSGVSGTRYTYSSWSDSGAQSHSITVPSTATTYTANFTTQYSLTTAVSPSGSGTITANPSGTWYNSGTSVQLAANAGTGYSFSSWTGGVTGSSNPTSITMNSAKSATANFTSQTQYTLTIGVSPSGSGSVSLNPNTSTYSSGEQVTLTATANSGYAFSSWSGDVTGTTNPTSVTVDRNKTVTANFTATPGTLVVTPLNGLTASGSAGGPFTPSSAGYILQNTGGTTLNWISSAVQTWISLSPSSGSLAPGASITVTVSINDNAKRLLPGSYNDTVSFSETTATSTSRAYGASNATRPVALTVDGTMLMLSYRVATSPSGLRVKVDGTEYKTPKKFTWAVGSEHTLDVSTPQVGRLGKRYVFTSWSDGPGQSHTIMAPSSSTTYTASFTTQYSLATSVNIPEGGTVSISGPTTNGNLPQAGTGDPAEGIWYDKDQVVTLSAAPNFEHNLRNWSTGSRTNPLSITMNGPKKIRANFKQNTYTIKVVSNSLGVVTKSPKKSTYVYGEQVTLTAIPKSGYILGSWNGDVSGAQNPFIVTVTGNMNVGASFTTYDGSPSLPSGDSLADSSADSLTLIGELESPVDGKSISGVKPIYGWALDGEGISKVELFVDGNYVCDIPLGGMREDIGAEHSQYPNADKNGFAMIWNYSAMSPGEHIVKIKVHNLKGETIDLASTVFVNKFYAQTVNLVAPQGVWMYDVNVTGDGITKPYDLKLEWSDQSQGFEIIEVVTR